MNFVLFLSDFILPFTVLYIVGYGLLTKVNVFDEFVDGAKDGLRVVVGIVPTLVGLMVGIGIMRASGSLDMLSNLIKPLTDLFHFPSQLVPLALVKMFSSSAANSLLLDIFKQYGPDSYLGRLSSIMMSCTETIFYTMAVYFMAAKVTKTRYTLAGALVATISGIIGSVIICQLVF